MLLINLRSCKMLILNVPFIDILLNFLLPNSVKQYSQKKYFLHFLMVMLRQAPQLPIVWSLGGSILTSSCQNVTVTFDILTGAWHLTPNCSWWSGPQCTHIVVIAINLKNIQFSLAHSINMYTVVFFCLLFLFCSITACLAVIQCS